MKKHIPRAGKVCDKCGNRPGFCICCRQIPGQAGVAKQHKIDKINQRKLLQMIERYSQNDFARKLTKAVFNAKKKALRK